MSHIALLPLVHYETQYSDYLSAAFVALRLVSQNSQKEKKRWGIDEALLILPLVSLGLATK